MGPNRYMPMFGAKVKTAATVSESSFRLLIILETINEHYLPLGNNYVSKHYIVLAQQVKIVLDIFKANASVSAVMKTTHSVSIECTDCPKLHNML